MKIRYTIILIMISFVSCTNVADTIIEGATGIEMPVLVSRTYYTLVDAKHVEIPYSSYMLSCENTNIYFTSKPIYVHRRYEETGVNKYRFYVDFVVHNNGSDNIEYNSNRILLKIGDKEYRPEDVNKPIVTIKPQNKYGKEEIVFNIVDSASNNDIYNRMVQNEICMKLSIHIKYESKNKWMSFVSNIAFDKNEK